MLQIKHKSRLFLKVLISLFFTFSISASHAGMKGFTAVFMDVGGQNFYESRVYKAFTDGYPAMQKNTDCWNSRATGGERFKWVIRKKIPKGLTQEMAQAIWNGDKKTTKAVQKIIAKGTASDGENINGMYIINAQNEKISLMSLGINDSPKVKNPSRKITIKWNETNPSQGAIDFDLALCRVSNTLDVGFAP